MTVLPVSLAAEGLLDEQILRRLLKESGRAYAPGVCYGKRGRPHLVENLPRFNRAAQHHPFIVLADLDSDQCPPGLINAWLNTERHANLLLRIAVREMESWLLADWRGLAGFLGVSSTSIPRQPDELPDPKDVLVNLARGSRFRTIRDGVAPLPGSTSRIGREYVSQLSRFVAELWNVESACRNSPSLDRAMRALRAFAPKLA